MIFGRFFQFSANFPKSIFPFRNPTESPKKWFWGVFSLFSKFSEVHFSLQKSCRKSEKMIFERFFQFSSNFPKSVFSLQKSYRKSEKAILGVIFQFSAKVSKSDPLPTDTPLKSFFGIFQGGGICSGSTSLYFPLEIKKYFSKSKISGGDICK